jgi:hypothetical protein
VTNFRLVKYPDDDPANVELKLEKSKSLEERLSIFKRESFSILNAIELDATQHPEIIFHQLESILNTKGIFIDLPFVHPVVLPPPEGGFQGFSEESTLKHYAGLNLLEGEPERVVSEYKYFCCVQYALNGTLELADMNHCCSYRVIYGLQRVNYISF